MTHESGPTGGHQKQELTSEYFRERSGVVAQPYSNEKDAEAAVHSLINAGFTSDHIGTVARDEESARQGADDSGTNTAERIDIGMLSGGVLGGIAAPLKDATAVVIPGIGLVATGPIAVVAESVGAGGGIVDSLTALGVDDSDARQYQQRVEAGDILIAVVAGGQVSEARNILQYAHAHREH